MSPAAKAAPTRRSRGSLSEEEILNGAITLVERDGLEGLSMPILARHLGAGVMSLYWYFHSKEELLAAMAERTIHEVYARLTPPGDGPWDEEMTRLMTEFADEMRQTPLFAELCCWRPHLLASRPGILKTLANRFDQELRLLERIGGNPAEAANLHNVLSAFTVGFAQMQLGAATRGDEPTAKETLEELVERLDPVEFPVLRSLSDVGALVALDDDEFDDVLGFLVAGMKAEYGPPTRSRSSARAKRR